MARRTAISAALLASATVAAAARADSPSIDARTYRPSTDPNASLVVEPAVTPGPGVLTLGAYGAYAYRPITLRRAGTDDVAYRPLEKSLTVDAIANLGIGERLAIGASLPVMLFQDGTRPLPPTVSSVDETPASAIGDLALDVKGALVRNENGGFGLAGVGRLSLPTGDRASFAGEGAITAGVRFIAEYTLLVAVAQASLGYDLRPERRTWPDASVGGYRFGDDVPWSLGIAMRPGFLGVDPGNRQRWELAVHGWLPAGPVGPFGMGDPGSAALSPLLLAASDRVELGHYRDTFVTIGGEVGLVDAIGVPAVRAIVGFGWTPRAHDLDHDGVKDDVDGCPEIPEDKDGFEDEDGCPEIDNDEDGIIDREDACPNQAGPASSIAGRNGCPIKDADGDGIDDTLDACPRQKGPPSKDPKRNGCPVKDTDGDGIDDALDRCPTQAEDKDGFQDEDGCPDPDNDADGIADVKDACPDVPGERSDDPKQNGCPNPDRDGDTFDNAVDKCPDAAETWNGVEDDDGCPDEGGKALVTIDAKRAVRFARPIKLASATPEVDAESIPLLRALATELAKHRDWTVAVGVRPTAGEPSKAQEDALGRAFAIVQLLARYTRRDDAAEITSWDTVKAQPNASGGIGLLVLTPEPRQDPPKAAKP